MEAVAAQEEEAGDQARARGSPRSGVAICERSATARSPTRADVVLMLAADDSPRTGNRPGPEEGAMAVHLRPLDPFDFLERAALVYPDKLAVVDGPARRTYPRVPGAGAAAGRGAASARRAGRRAGRGAGAQHLADARGDLRRAAGGRRAVRAQHAPGAERDRLHPGPLRGGAAAPRPRARRLGRAAGDAPAAGARRRASTRRCWRRPTRPRWSAARSTKTTRSRSTTPAARPAGPRA